MGIRTAKVSPIFSFLTAPWRTLKPNAPESEESGISNNLWNTSVKFLTAAMNRGDLLRLSTAFDKVGTASISSSASILFPLRMALLCALLGLRGRELRERRQRSGNVGTVHARERGQGRLAPKGSQQLNCCFLLNSNHPRL